MSIDLSPEGIDSPVIVLDRTKRARLRSKFFEYEARIDPYKPPECQMGAIMKMEVLSALLEKGRVETWALSLELAKKYGPGFDVDAFNNACAVIQDYNETGGTKVRGGTGLPKEAQ